MDKLDHDRILDIFQSGKTPSEEEWQWLNHYLSLADKLFLDAQKAKDTPPTLVERVDEFLKKKTG